MILLPDLEPCAQCHHKRGEHASTAAGSFNVHPVHYGRCRVAGCDCGEYQPKPTSDQSESDRTMVMAGARLARMSADARARRTCLGLPLDSARDASTARIEESGAPHSAGVASDEDRKNPGAEDG